MLRNYNSCQHVTGAIAFRNWTLQTEKQCWEPPPQEAGSISAPQPLHLSTAGRHWEMPPFPGDSSFDSTHAHSCNLRHLVLAKNTALMPVNAATLRWHGTAIRRPGAAGHPRKVPKCWDVPQPRLFVLSGSLGSLPVHRFWTRTTLPCSWLIQAAQVTGIPLK